MTHHTNIQMRLPRVSWTGTLEVVQQTLPTPVNPFSAVEHFMCPTCGGEWGKITPDAATHHTFRTVACTARGCWPWGRTHFPAKGIMLDLDSPLWQGLQGEVFNLQIRAHLLLSAMQARNVGSAAWNEELAKVKLW